MTPKQLAVKKWTKILYGHADRAMDDCPFCELYCDGWKCGGCPIAAASGQPFCLGTPYVRWLIAVRHGVRYICKERALKSRARAYQHRRRMLYLVRDQAQLDAAMAMLDFIKSLPGD